MDDSRAVARWREIFLSCSEGLNLNAESHEGGVIKFLDLKLVLRSAGRPHMTTEPLFPTGGE